MLGHTQELDVELAGLRAEQEPAERPAANLAALLVGKVESSEAVEHVAEPLPVAVAGQLAAWFVVQDEPVDLSAAEGEKSTAVFAATAVLAAKRIH